MDTLCALVLGFELVEREDVDSSSDEEELPNGWERRVVRHTHTQVEGGIIPSLQDSNGRRVFINHVARSTSLRRPNRRQPTAPSQPSSARTYLPRLNSTDVREREREGRRGREWCVLLSLGD